MKIRRRGAVGRSLGGRDLGDGGRGPAGCGDYIIF